jgi:predicted ATPase
VITELGIAGFKSFGTSAQRIPLGRLNFVVGANAAGKTNLISALRFLQLAVLHDTAHAVEDFGGNAEVRNKILREKTRPKPLELRIAMKFTAPGILVRKNLYVESFDYHARIDVRSETAKPRVDFEHLRSRLYDPSEMRHSDYELKREGTTVTLDDPSNGAPARNEYEVPEQDATRLALGVGLFSPPTVILRHLISNWRFYSISPDLARLPVKDVPGLGLGSHGENLAAVLHRLEEGKDGELEAVIQGLRGVVPGFQSIKTQRLPVEGKWAFQVAEEKIKTLNPSSVSDGTIRLLALMVIANWLGAEKELLPGEVPLVCIEGPENGLHPHLSSHLVEVLRVASEQRQLLVTTHNPAFLDELEPTEILLCDKQDGFTNIKRASEIEEIDRFRTRFRLGELWVQGVLGGAP